MNCARPMPTTSIPDGMTCIILQWLVIDLFRVSDGKIVEHWNAEQDVPETAANDNTMF